MKFQSKVDGWLALVLVGSVGVCLAAAFYLIVSTNLTESGWVVLSMLLIGVGLPMWLLLSTNYRVEGDWLAIRSGPYRWRIAVSDIQEIRPSRSILSSPALSLDRLEICHAGGSVMISPKDKSGFIAAIEQARKLNPTV
ncbi:PH domain-containing protein [Marinobacter hydrocarbonoclasticus]|nr:PH domain-containing protein [Marinobacter nauticus]